MSKLLVTDQAKRCPVFGESNVLIVVLILRWKVCSIGCGTHVTLVCAMVWGVASIVHLLKEEYNRNSSVITNPQAFRIQYKLGHHNLFLDRVKIFNLESQTLEL